jgi:hypothetical protein
LSWSRSPPSSPSSCRFVSSAPLCQSEKESHNEYLCDSQHKLFKRSSSRPSCTQQLWFGLLSGFKALMRGFGCLAHRNTNHEVFQQWPARCRGASLYWDSYCATSPLLSQASTCEWDRQLPGRLGEAAYFWLCNCWTVREWPFKFATTRFENFSWNLFQFPTSQSQSFLLFCIQELFVRSYDHRI